jgi:hypothetical protein
MKKKSVKKLKLAKETMRRLSGMELGDAVGAASEQCGTFVYSICGCNSESAVVDCPYSACGCSKQDC